MGIVVGENLVGVDPQVVGVGSQKSADVDIWQIDIERVALEIIEVLAADLCRLRGLSHCDASLLPGFL